MDLLRSAGEKSKHEAPSTRRSLPHQGHARPPLLPSARAAATSTAAPALLLAVRTQLRSIRSRMAGTGDARRLSASRMDIQILLSDGRPICRSIFPDDTLGALVEDLRRMRRLVGVSAIRVESNAPLTTSHRWRYLTMAEIGIQVGQPLNITTFRPAAVKVLKFVPQKYISVDTKTVPITDCESADVDAIELQLRKLSFDPVEPSAVTVQCLSLYSRSGEKHRAVWSFDERNQEYVYVDEITGEKEREDQRLEHILTILSSGSGLVAAASQSHIPVVQLYTDCEVLTLDETAQLKLDFQTELHYSDHLVLMLGLRLSDRNGVVLATMLRLCGGEYLDIASGKVFVGENAVANAKPNGKLKHLHILASSSSLLPQYPIPARKTVLAYTRSGWEVCLKERRVQGQKTSHAESGSIWVVTWNSSDFDHQLTRAMSL